MPPNRRTSLSIHDVRHHGLCYSQNTVVVVTAKDAIAATTKPTIDESYWHWPTVEQQQQHTPPSKNLFSANHYVANLVRDASREEEKHCQDDHVDDEEHSPEDSRDYWNPNPPPQMSVDDRWTAPTTTKTDAAHDDWWNWTSFSHSSRRFSHDHYERQLTRRAAAEGSRTTMLQQPNHDDYWAGL
jgi:hypothetical protein